MKLTILNVAYPFAPVGPDAIGGAEQILTMIEAALVEAGHRCITLAPAGSVTRGELIAFDASEAPLTEAGMARARAAYRGRIASILAAEHVDVVHYHGVDFPTYIHDGGPPSLATLHLRPAWYPDCVYQIGWRPNLTLNCVSAHQARAIPPLGREAEIIENGVEPFDAPCAPQGAHAMMLGRVCPEKGYERGLAAARLADVDAILAGETFPYPDHLAHYHTRIKPLLDERRRHVGPLGRSAKRRALATARCLLVPSLVPETSSLVAMEAMMAGTPVVAFRAGALVEIIEDGVTGFLVNSPEEMASAIHRVAAFDRALIREIARERFSSARMTREYLMLIERLGASRRGAVEVIEENARR